jgi:hypothetical protein
MPPGFSKSNFMEEKATANATQEPPAIGGKN